MNSIISGHNVGQKGIESFSTETKALVWLSITEYVNRLLLKCMDPNILLIKHLKIWISAYQKRLCLFTSIIILGFSLSAQSISGGIAALSSLSSTLEYAPDGIDFTSNRLAVKVKNFPKAPGAYRNDLNAPTAGGDGLTWGISMVHNGNEAYLVRYKVHSK